METAASADVETVAPWTDLYRPIHRTTTPSRGPARLGCFGKRSGRTDHGGVKGPRPRRRVVRIRSTGIVRDAAWRRTVVMCRITARGRSGIVQVGINYPWYSNTFGNNLFTPQLVPDFDDTLRRLVPRGVSVVRVWLLCQLDRWGHLENLAGSPRFHPPEPTDPPLLAEAIDRFESLLSICEQRHVQVIPSLLCHDALGDPRRAAGNGGRVAIVSDPETRARFFADVLEPFLSASDPHRSQIYAWELMNEPAWNVISWLGWRHHAFAREIDRRTLAQFLQEGLDHIAQAGFASTIGHARVADLEQLPTGTVPQFHYYGIPQLWVPEQGTSRAFVGELSSTRARWWPSDPTEVPWPMLLGADLADDETAVLERLRLLRRQGYSLALLWPGGEEGPGSEKYGAAALNAIERFAGEGHPAAVAPRPR